MYMKCCFYNRAAGFMSDNYLQQVSGGYCEVGSFIFLLLVVVFTLLIINMLLLFLGFRSSQKGYKNYSRSICYMKYSWGYVCIKPERVTDVSMTQGLVCRDKVRPIL